jgi:hypothetical protein
MAPDPPLDTLLQARGMATPTSAKRVTVLGTDPDGRLSVKSEMVATPTKERKGTKAPRNGGKNRPNSVNMVVTTGESYLSRRNKSNQKKKADWIGDAPVSVIRAGMKGVKNG